MTNLFLKVNKDLFKLKLTPIEILLISQIMEFNTNTGDCYISDKVLAEQFGVSDSTVSRGLSSLENKKFITRETKNTKGGKVRHIKINLNKIEEALTSLNLTVVNEAKEQPQASKCCLPSLNLTVANKQNDFIKDKVIDNLKDNLTIEEKPEEGTINNPVVVKREWLAERANIITKTANGLFKYNNKFYKMEDK